jgi:hypothetical protein
MSGVLVIAVITVVVVLIAQSSDPAKGDITRLTPEMLVDHSSFPEINGMVFKGPDYSGSQDKLPTIPPECASLEYYPTGTQWERLGMSDPADEYGFAIAIVKTTERPDFHDAVGKCGTFKFGTVDGYSIQSRDLRGLPEWATAYQANDPSYTTAAVVGVYRGIFIKAAHGRKLGDGRPEDTDALVKLFNDQVAKLEAA